MGSPTSSVRYRQHSSWDHVTTQAPPLRQSRYTFGGNSKHRSCQPATHNTYVTSQLLRSSCSSPLRRFHDSSHNCGARSHQLSLLHTSRRSGLTKLHQNYNIN
jgi:hypothetical protein